MASLAPKTPVAASTVEPAQALDPRRWLALLVALTGPFLSAVDFFVVNVSIPSSQRDLRASFAQVELVIAGYGLAYAVFVITGGRLGDIAGRKRMFLLGMAGFTLASALCGLAPTIEVLILARVLQATTAALMLPQVLSIIQVTFPDAERPRAFALFGVCIGLGSVTGQFMGGVLTAADLFGSGWRAIFLVNLPIGVAALWTARRLLHESRASRPVALDWGGVGLASLALALLLVPLVEGRELAWPPWTGACFALAPVALALFVFYERALTRRGSDPLVDIGLFRARAFSLGLCIILAYSGGQASFYLTLTLYLQRGAGLSPIQTAASFAPCAIGLLCASLLTARFATRLGARLLIPGLALMAAGLALMGLHVHSAGTAPSRSILLTGIVLYGFGQGCATPSIYSAILRGVPRDSAGAASGVLSTVQQVAAALGVAGIGVVFFGVLGADPAPERYALACASALACNVALAVSTIGLVCLLQRAEVRARIARDFPVPARSLHPHE